MNDGLAALRDLVALSRAGSPEELWWELLTGGGLPPGPNSWDAAMLWREHHGDGQPGAVDTALLLCTDHRWQRDTSRLIASIASSGCIASDGRAELASRFLAGTTIVWEAPAAWSAGGWIEIPLDGDDRDIRDVPADDALEPILFPRRVPPPLHRWAAAELVRHDPGGWVDVWKQAQALDPPATGAALAGMLDAVAHVREPSASEILVMGLAWPRGFVRVVALERLAERNGSGVAVELAKDDPDSRVRAWADKRLRSATRLAKPASGGGDMERPRPTVEPQATLF